ncbi:rasGEF domain-containing protein [Hirsutella rhossiliensis]|uniref:RasGEF domain-containing protein n=1 Tax=Hirsutella rhossiliensis TaxID=111463 RepID=A0A9P8SG61_9HYPO|nr:rasGEF domain-containing protein [Hirsutella rhossiliensis]KAH0960799.1 rasGEF domain-containing protein [Hirsutella rhossiliensis]
MDAVESQSSTTRPPPLNLAEPKPLRKYASATNISPKRLPRDAKLKRCSPGAPGRRDTSAPNLMIRPTTKSTTKTATRAALTAARPLVPVTERRSHEDRNTSSAKGDPESGRWDIAPDGTSAGREGRQFTVANVGNNGRIYLRPTVRPAHQRCPQPNFAFPLTPPSTGGIEAFSQEKPKGRKEGKEQHASQLQTSQWTPTPSTSLLAGDDQYFPDAWNSGGRTRQRRAMSDSTMNDSGIANERDKDAFRVVISKPGDDKRPRTMEDLDTALAPLLDINIPSWRIGTPRFTLRGTPQSSRTPSLPASEPRARKLNPLAIHPPPAGPSARRGARGLPSPRLLRSTYMSTHLAIEPAMFTDLTFKPACDDKTIVRYSPVGAVTAATPPRLVAEITSPSFLDYELISDFFLTFRSFLDSTDLLRMLVARLRWALMRNDEVGMIVRVRTFVAVRHWILNYFLDDFVLEYDLRVTFCELLNEFVDELSQDASCRKVRLKILAELKKCWRRVCAEHWDGPQFDDSLGPEVPIAPGGLAGNRDPGLDPSHWEREGIEPQLDGWVPMPKVPTESASFSPDAPGAAPIGDFIVLGNRPGTPENPVGHRAGVESGGGSPLSLASLDIVSCSFPAKLIRAPNPDAALSKHAHPVSSPTPMTNGFGQVATTPKALVGKRIRPTQTHKRNNSTSDSLREHGSEKSSSHDHDFSAPWPSAGSLVRGDLLPPGQPFVNYEPHALDGGRNRQTTIFQPNGRALAKERAAGSAMSGRGMNKLLGSVRRALRPRGQAFSPWHAQFMGISPVGPGSTTRLPGTAVVPQDLPRQTGGRPPVRIDLLGAAVAEDFKVAIREEEAAAEAERLGLTVPPNSAPPFGRHPDYSAAHMESSTFDSLPQNQKPRAVSDMGITIGSKSIVIVDDTLPRADPTPPDTPPTTSTTGDTPRRSSYLVNQDVAGPPTVDGALLPFLPHTATVDDDQSGHISGDLGQPSLPVSRRMRRPPMSGGTFRMHRDNRSAGTIQSLDSVIHSRCVSLSGSAVPSSTIRSFDAAADAPASTADEGFDVPEPAPLRVLRRRPGGDLRAATNIGDLDRESLRRSLSVGSLATYTESVQSSYLLNTRPNSAGRSDSVPSLAQDGRRQAFSVGQLAEKSGPVKVSLLNTHSSKPAMRPSFEREAQFLAQIPDDEDDGGIESALLKLEGKYEKKQSTMPVDLTSPATVEEDGTADFYEDGVDDRDSATRKRERKENRHVHVLDEAIATRESVGGQLPLQELSGESEGEQGPAPDMKSFLSEGSHDSYYSIPLLQRELTNDSRSKTATWEWTDRSVLRGSDEEDSPVATDGNPSAAEGDEAHHMSFDLVQKTDSLERIKPGESAPSEVENQSFLDDGTDDTDLSSELSTDGAGTCAAEGGDVLVSKHRPPGNGSARQLTLIQALAMTPGTGDVASQAAARSPLLPTPEMTGPDDALAGVPKPIIMPLRKYSVHLPFILAFDSDILAQQLTLIEKDALNDIDWKELIDMKWKNAARSDSRSWVDFLRHSDAQGVEVVIARFNIMVKWAISEIVLTQKIEERARCIIKLIHIASHCRRYRNFATLAQLTIALSSSEVARLAKTWELVPAHDIQTLSALESLITPTRNFHAVRAEMEMGSDAGCIPFVGIYTHDLLYNAQRPSEIASSPTTAPLINFERCRIGAAVAKTLLRLLEASTRYTFLPIEGITERCLWIGALSDEEIRRRADGLE